MANLSFLHRVAAAATERLHRRNSDTALRCAIELMLTDRKTVEVIAQLREWVAYLEDRK